VLSEGASCRTSSYREGGQGPTGRGYVGETGRDSVLGRISDISTGRIEATLRALELEKVGPGGAWFHLSRPWCGML
jgi:hypothetical protein